MGGQRSPDDIPTCYQIAVRGTLDPRWLDWFGDLTISHDDAGNTLLVGPIADQAALYGLINRMRDLGLTLLGVVRVSSEAGG